MGPASTTLPWDITTSLCARSAATWRSWVTSRTAVPDTSEALEMVEDDTLHGDVERAGGLVGDDQLGLCCDGDGDQSALPHSAGQFVRILPGPDGRVGQPGPVQHGDRLGGSRAAGCQTVDEQHLGDLVADPLDRLRETVGSWGTSPIRAPRTVRSSASDRVARS